MNILEQLLAGRFRDPDSGALVRSPVPRVEIGPGLAGHAGELLREAGLEGRFAIVADATTWEVLGARIEAALASRDEPIRVVLPAGPHADMATARRVSEACADADALIAVGSGTVNDLCKWSAARLARPYAVFGTAPSMNGYASSSAAITVDGLKSSLPATTPHGLFLDLDVLCEAPVRLIRSGLGDSVCRPTAQFDWLLAHGLRDTPYRSLPFALLAGDEGPLLDEAEGLVRGDRAVMHRLASTLVLSGMGMTLCGGSYPASQGEHLISHFADMFHPSEDPPLHGEQVGVAALTLAKIQRRLLDDRKPRLAATALSPSDLSQHLGPSLALRCWPFYVAKTPVEASQRAAWQQRIDAEWDGLRARLEAISLPVERIGRALRAVGAPLGYADLGWSAAFYRRALTGAHLIRDRFTALDLAAALGWLEDFARDETAPAEAGEAGPL